MYIRLYKNDGIDGTHINIAKSRFTEDVYYVLQYKNT
jgi:hypothetical protein